MIFDRIPMGTAVANTRAADSLDSPERREIVEACERIHFEALRAQQHVHEREAARLGADAAEADDEAEGIEVALAVGGHHDAA